MRRALTIVWLTLTIQVYAQVDKFPAYKLIDIDSFDFKQDAQYFKTIKLTKDTLGVNIDAKPFLFTPSRRNSNFFYPIFSSEYDSKYDLEIAVWEIGQIENDAVAFKITYTKRYKKNGSQKGKYFTIDSLKISKDEIEGVYMVDESKMQQRKISIIEIALLTIITTGALLVGPQ